MWFVWECGAEAFKQVGIAALVAGFLATAAFLALFLVATLVGGFLARLGIVPVQKEGFPLSVIVLVLWTLHAVAQVLAFRHAMRKTLASIPQPK